MIESLQRATTELISTSNQSEVTSFNHLTKVIGMFAQLVENKVQTLGAILLNQQNFS